MLTSEVGVSERGTDAHVIGSERRQGTAKEKCMRKDAAGYRWRHTSKYYSYSRGNSALFIMYNYEYSTSRIMFKSLFLN